MLMLKDRYPRTLTESRGVLYKAPPLSVPSSKFRPTQNSIIKSHQHT